MDTEAHRGTQGGPVGRGLTHLTVMVSHVQRYISKCQNLLQWVL